ncbi:MAG TPA: 5-oxoprolinase subunit PxpA [Candidatus Acidoferrum sp.]|nr:5-oxoprolinase subunit PxpA [Candidatus Acidoferrum sp.]
MGTKIDLNCDLGESYGEFKVGNDEKIMPYITSANIACGFHAGDPITISKTISMAREHNVAIGAHPSFPDLMGFGRREMQLTSEETKNYLIYQISALQGFAKIAGTNLQHVKPHGALYNMAAKDEKLAKAITEAIETLDNALIVFAPPKSILTKVAEKTGLIVAYEFFADRAYNPDGSLVSRKQSNAIIEEPEKVVERAVQAVTEEKVLAMDGSSVKLGEVHTICVHGDTPSAVKLAQALKRGLTKAGIDVEPVGNFI